MISRTDFTVNAMDSSRRPKILHAMLVPVLIAVALPIAGCRDQTLPGGSRSLGVIQELFFGLGGNGPGAPIRANRDAAVPRTALPAADVFLITGGALNMPTAELYDSTSKSIVAFPGPMNSNRQYQSATVLQDGSILIAGGRDTLGVDQATAEIYDPVKQTFTPTTGNLNLARDDHTATLLPSGEVLIAGGYNNFTPQNSAELYNPVTQTFANAGTMTDARGFFTATLLNNGKVLLAGGADQSSNSVDTAELYDPVAGTFTATPNMTVARADQAAVTLNDGTVLLVGGDNNGTAEIYDPVANSFTAVTGASGIYAQYAVLLGDGTVLVASGVSTSAWIYDPTAKTFTPTVGNMTTVHSYGAATLLANGAALIAGGYNASGGFQTPAAATDIYDPVAGTFSAGPLMYAYRDAETVTAIASTGQVLIAGGENNFANMTQSEVWDPTQNQFVAVGPMNQDRSFHTATLLPNGQVLIAGGATATFNGTQPTGGSVTSSAELFDPTTGVFSFTASFCSFVPPPVNPGCMNSNRAGHTATMLNNGKVLLAGGTDGSNVLAFAELYDPSSNTFTPTSGNMTTARIGDTATLLPNGQVLLAGGQPGTAASGSYSPVASAELYNPIADKFSATGAMTSAREAFTATLLSNGQVLIAGGADATGKPSASAELYNPKTGKFAKTGAMTDARTGQTATLMSDGRVLIVGGYDMSGLTASAEIYYPATGKFVVAGSLSEASAGASAGLLPDGTVMIVGGYGAGTPMDQLLDAPMVNGVTLHTAESYNPTMGKFTIAGDLPWSEVGAATVLLTSSQPQPTPGGKIAVAPPLGHFPLTGIGVTPTSRNFIVHNLDRKNTLTGTVTGPSAPFQLSPNVTSLSIAPGQKETLTVVFTPTGTGKATGALEFTGLSDPKRQSLTVPLLGTGEPGKAVVAKAVAFLPTKVGATPYPTRTLILKNAGPGMLAGSVGTLTAPFTVLGGSFNLAPHGTDKIQIQFAPTAKGKDSETLAITINPPATPATINVRVLGAGK